MDFVSLVEVSSTASDIVMEGVVNTLKARDIDIKKVRFSSLDGTNSMSGIHNGLQRRLRNHAPHAIYINCRCHRLALCFKHLFEEFTWLQSIDSLLLGLWKTFHFSSKNRFILHEIQKAYGMKSLNVIKAAVTRWLSHGAACKRCRERYGMILGSLDDIITRNPRPELIGYRDEMLNAQTVLQITFLEDVLTITNILTCATVQLQRFQSSQQDMLFFSTTLTTLNDMQNISSVHLKSFSAYQDVLSQTESFAKQNILAKHTRKKLRIDHLISIKEFHENIGKSFLVRLAGI